MPMHTFFEGVIEGRRLAPEDARPLQARQEVAWLLLADRKGQVGSVDLVEKAIMARGAQAGPQVGTTPFWHQVLSTQAGTSFASKMA